MKYFYEKPDICKQVFGRTIVLDHPVYRRGTLYLENGVGIIVVQQRFGSAKYAYWDAIDPWLANDIYLNKNFPYFFSHNASKEFPIFQVRKLMWALRMKPIPKEDWEDYF